MKFSDKIGYILTETFRSPSTNSYVVGTKRGPVVLREGGTYEGVNLAGANLSGLQLNKINLRDSDLSNTNLTGVRFRNANLSGVNFKGAVIVGTDFTGSQIDQASLAETVECVGPIGVTI